MRSGLGSITARAALAALAAAVPLACGKSGDDAPASGGFRIPGSTAAGLAFATVDSAYTSSRIWFADFGTGETRELLTGESGDPWLKWDGEGLLVFNRDARKSLSYYAFDPRPATAAPGPQRAAPGVGGGDPYDVLNLGGGRLMLAHAIAGKLSVIDREAATEVAVLPAGTGLKPAALLAVETPAGPRVAVLHQGLDASFNPDGTQRIVLLAEAGGAYTVAGEIPLRTPNPGLLVADDAAPGSVLVAGGCTSLHTCGEGGVERVDLASGTTEVVLDLKPTGLKGNGGYVAAGGGVLYALTAPAEGPKRVSRLDLTAGTADTVHEFPADSFGCCALFHDASSGTLIVGDQTKEGEGFFTIYGKNAAAPEKVDLAGVPNAGALAPR